MPESPKSLPRGPRQPVGGHCQRLQSSVGGLWSGCRPTQSPEHLVPPRSLRGGLLGPRTRQGTWAQESGGRHGGQDLSQKGGLRSPPDPEMRLPLRRSGGQPLFHLPPGRGLLQKVAGSPPAPGLCWGPQGPPSCSLQGCPELQPPRWPPGCGLSLRGRLAGLCQGKGAPPQAPALGAPFLDLGQGSAPAAQGPCCPLGAGGRAPAPPQMHCCGCHCYGMEADGRMASRRRSPPRPAPASQRGSGTPRELGLQSPPLVATWEPGAGPLGSLWWGGCPGFPGASDCWLRSARGAPLPASSSPRQCRPPLQLPLLCPLPGCCSWVLESMGRPQSSWPSWPLAPACPKAQRAQCLACPPGGSPPGLDEGRLRQQRKGQQWALRGPWEARIQDVAPTQGGGSGGWRWPREAVAGIANWPGEHWGPRALLCFLPPGLGGAKSFPQLGRLPWLPCHPVLSLGSARGQRRPQPGCVALE